MGSDTCPECFTFEWPWLALNYIVMILVFWYLWSPSSDTASKATSAAGSTVATPPPPAQRRPRPPIKYLDPIALTRGLGDEYPALGARPHRYLSIAPPVPLRGSDPKKPFVAERHCSPYLVRNRWELAAASALPPKKPIVVDGAEHARTLANLRAALSRPGASEVFVPPQGIVNYKAPTPIHLRPMYHMRPGPRRMQQRVWPPPTPLISLAPSSRPAVPPKQQWFS